MSEHHSKTGNLYVYLAEKHDIRTVKPVIFQNIIKFIYLRKTNLLMKTIYTFLVLLLLLNVSCDTTPKMTALEFNDAIINEQTDIVKVMLEFSSTIETNIEEADNVRKQIISQCDSSLMKISALQDIEGGIEFKNAGIALFNFYKDMSKSEYHKILEILEKENINDEDLDELTKIQTTIESKEKQVDTRFQAAQTNFAKLNNLKIGGNELQNQIDQLGE